MRNARCWWLLVGALLAPAVGGGCFPNPFSMGLGTPIPIQPWVAEWAEERLGNAGRIDNNTVIMPAIPAGYRPLCEDPPDRASILRAMPRVARGVPYFYEEFRDDYEFTVERMVDHIDPPRFYPLVGPAQLHHCHYKCVVYFTETKMSGYPFPFQVKRRRSETVYIDRDHLHVVACTPESQQAVTRDMTQYRP